MFSYKHLIPTHSQGATQPVYFPGQSRYIIKLEQSFPDITGMVAQLELEDWSMLSSLVEIEVLVRNALHVVDAWV